MFKYDSDLSVGSVNSDSKDSSFDWSGLAASAIDAGTDIFNNERNLRYQRETNAKNEELMRESWAREDNAVQRRVADLKKAGLSPTLAAGSAAASGSPVQMVAPKSNLRGGYGAQTLAALSAVKSLKNQDLQNELLYKQIKNYGKPDWLVALSEIFGTDKFEAMIHGLGDKLYNLLVGDGSSGSVWERLSNQGGEDPTTDPSSSSHLRDNIYHKSTWFGFGKGEYPSLFNHVDFYSNISVDGGTMTLGHDQYEQLKDLADISGMSFDSMKDLLWDWYNNGGGASVIRRYNRNK